MEYDLEGEIKSGYETIYVLGETVNRNISIKDEEIKSLQEIRENLLSTIKDYRDDYEMVKVALNSVLIRLKELSVIEVENKALKDKLKSVSENNARLQQQISRLKERHKVLEEKSIKLQGRLDNLRKSKLGRITVGYWEFKKKLKKS